MHNLRLMFCFPCLQLPFKVLDAPALRDDYYLNLLDWNCHNVLAVGLGSSVHLHNATTGEVKSLWEEDEDEGSEYISSVAWAPDGKHVAVGFSGSHVEIWSVSPVKKVSIKSSETRSTARSASDTVRTASGLG